jgi:tol-pal system protein YbgF
MKKQDKQIAAFEQDIQSIYVQLDNLSNLSDLPIESEHPEYNRLAKQLNLLQQELASIKLKQDNLKQERKVTKPTTQSKPQPKSTPSTTQIKEKSMEDVLYQSGREAYEARNLTEAVKHFRDFLKKYPDHKLAANSQYWLGECYYSLENFEYARNEFQKVIDFYSKSSKVPDSHVKIALIYKKEGLNQQAIIELERIVKLYPNYERKELVEYLLKELK